ncbi:hypothetical protein FHS27_004646 [Rhodopirellula rubra]|uniref:Uncharacterized protein n=1 Tax=Aporhodopirellula rubra TaxID=980271 RepID=A0A7W5E3B6_9BACT|nr:hypothetical protein [Aporhodopirellula rubra]
MIARRFLPIAGIPRNSILCGFTHNERNVHNERFVYELQLHHQIKMEGFI